MKKNVISGHMNPPKKGFGAFLKRLTIIPFLLCVILAIVLWLVAVNLRTASAEAETAAETALKVANSFVNAI